MAGDNNKKSAADTEISVSAAKVGDGGQTAGRFHFKVPRSKRSLFASFLIIIVIVAAIVLIVSHTSNPGQKVYAQAADHKIYKQDVDNLIKSDSSITIHQAATVLADKYLTQAMAQKDRITVTNQDIEKAYGSNIDGQKTQNPYMYQLQVNQLYFEKLQAYNSGIYKGYLLVAQFSRFISFVPSLEGDDSNLNNPTMIAADRSYADNFITNLYNQIKAGKITWDQAAQMEINDPTVGTRMYPTLSHSGPFDTSQTNLSRNNLIKPNSITKTIQSMKAGQISKPFVVSTTGGGSTKQVPTYYLVVRMDSVTGGKNGLSFAQALAQAKQQQGYKVNV